MYVGKFFQYPLDVLCPHVVGTSFSQHSKTQETPLPVIGVVTLKAFLNSGHLKHKTQHKLNAIKTL